MENVGEILAKEKEQIESCELVFLQAPGINRIAVVRQNVTLSGVKDKLRSLCLTAKKANYSEIENIYSEICKVCFVKVKGKSGK
jgi:hypothetical protein